MVSPIQCQITFSPRPGSGLHNDTICIQIKRSPSDPCRRQSTVYAPFSSESQHRLARQQYYDRGCGEAASGICHETLKISILPLIDRAFKIFGSQYKPADFRGIALKRVKNGCAGYRRLNDIFCLFFQVFSDLFLVIETPMRSTDRD